MPDDDARWLDELAVLLVAADDGDSDAETRLLTRYRSDDGLHPGSTVMQFSPYGEPPIVVALDRC